jgi:ankyrin repeat protein
MFDTPPQIEMVECCRRGDATRLRELLAYGVSASGNHNGQSFLTTAVIAGAEPCVRELLEHGARAVANDLARAIRSGCVPVAALILHDLHARNVPYDFWTDERPLLTDPEVLASISADMVEWMMVVGCDPNEQDRSGTNAIQAAQRVGVSPVILALLKAKQKRSR